MAKKHTHIHKYQKVKWGKKETEIFRCMLPDCSHYLHLEMALGKKSICHKCGRTFTLGKGDIIKVRPKCDNCVRHKEVVSDPRFKDLDDLLRNL
jgi:protein-arginine kinase activator protein McsA